jgi:hypothetical protein
MRVDPLAEGMTLLVLASKAIEFQPFEMTQLAGWTVRAAIREGEVRAANGGNSDSWSLRVLRNRSAVGTVNHPADDEESRLLEDPAGTRGQR